MARSSVAGTCRAAVVTAWGVMELRELPLPKIGREDGLLQVEVVGLCGTDWKIYSGRGAGGIGSLPLLLGHENVGRIAAVGDRAAERWGVGEGDRVIVESIIPCWACPSCRQGRYNLCSNLHSYGFSSVADPPHLWGGYAEYMYLHPHALVHKLSPEVPPSHAALFVALANGCRWAGRAPPVRPGDVVLIQGPGQQGLGCVIGAREARAGSIIVVGLPEDEARLEVARVLGADHVLVSDGPSIVERVAELTSGRMADVVVECSGSPAAQGQCPQLCRRGGTIVLAGTTGGREASVDFFPVTHREMTIKGVFTHLYDDVEQAIRVIESGRYPLEKLITHEFPLDQADLALRIVGRQVPGEDPIHVCLLP